MSVIRITRVSEISAIDRRHMAHALCREGSDFQMELRHGTHPADTPLALWITPGGAIVGWCCSHQGASMQTLEMFVAERQRGTGKALALASALCAAGIVVPSNPVAVFAQRTARIAVQIGLNDVQLYCRDDAGGYAIDPLGFHKL